MIAAAEAKMLMNFGKPDEACETSKEQHVPAVSSLLLFLPIVAAAAAGAWNTVFPVPCSPCATAHVTRCRRTPARCKFALDVLVDRAWLLIRLARDLP